jgi:Flp pilus assembly protein TadB
MSTASRSHLAVRDHEALGPTEDLEREPDGVPHHIVALTLVMSFALAVLLVAIAATGSLGIICATMIGLVTIPALVSALARNAELRRDHIHRSR